MKKPAFTLLELLVVITIIMVLVGFLIVDFNGARRQQELGLTVQQVLALMDQSRAEVDSGKVVVEEDLYLCLGGYFENGEVPQSVQMSYETNLEDCDFDSKVVENYGLVQSGAVIESIELEGQVYDKIWAMFVPPEGSLVFYDASGTSFVGDAVMSVQHSDNEELQRNLIFSTTTNRVSLEEKTN